MVQRRLAIYPRCRFPGLRPEICAWYIGNPRATPNTGRLSGGFRLWKWIVISIHCINLYLTLSELILFLELMCDLARPQNLPINAKFLQSSLVLFLGRPVMVEAILLYVH